MKEIVRFLGLLIGLLLLINNVSFASKFMASDFGWHKVGQDSFLITLTIYKDCNGASLGTAKIYFKNATTNSIIDSLVISAPSGTEVTPVCSSTQTRCQSSSSTFPYGISRYIYQGIIYLNNAGSCCSIRMSYQDTYRNTNITTGAASQPFYTEAIFNRCISPDDHAPGFSTPPIEIICVGQDHTYVPGILGNDTSSTGSFDSIVYEWASPLSNYNTSISYTGQYAYNKSIYFWGFPNEALPFPRGIHLDPQTGDIQFRPMKPEITVMVVKVKEYRNGSFIGEVRREIQTIVITCTNNNPPSIRTPNNVRSPSVCAGNPYSLTFSTDDPNSNDSVTINWNGGIPGATFTTTNGQSQHPTATFRWTPTDADVSSMAYTYTVTARDNACPINGYYTQAYQITVKPKPLANHTVIDSGCGLFYFNAQPIVGNGPSYLWQGKNFTFKPYTGSTVSHKFNVGTYPYSMTITASGCSNTYFDTIVADSCFSVDLPINTFVCKGTQLHIASQVLYSSGPVKYLWSTSAADTFSSCTITVTSDTMLFLTATDTLGCTSTDSMLIKIIKRNFPVSNDTIICYHNSDTLKASGGISYLWSTGDTTQTIVVNPAQSTTYYVQITDSSCVFDDSVRVAIFPSMNMHITPDTTICLGQTVRLEASGGVKYVWNTGDTLSFIEVSPSAPILYNVRLTDQYNCSSVASVYVDALPPPKVFAGNDSILCLAKGQYYLLSGTPSSGKGFWSGKSIFKDSSQNWYFDPYGIGINHLGNYPVYYHYSDSMSCLNTDTAFLTVSHNKSIDAGNNMALCISKSPVELLGTPSGGFWTGTGIIQNKYFDPGSAGTGKHILKYSLNEPCAVTDSVIIVVTQLPVIIASTLSGEKYFCKNEGLIQLNGQPSGGLWTGAVEQSNFFNTSYPDNNYTLIYHYADSAGCTGEDTMILTIAVPEIAIFSTNAFVCEGDILNLTATYSKADSIIWEKGVGANGTFTGNINNKNISYIPGTSDYDRGEFWILAKTISSVCPAVTASKIIKAGYNPVANFTANPLSGPVTLKVEFTNNSSLQNGKIVFYDWYFGDGNSSELFSRPHFYDKAGSFDVELIAISEAGCADTLIKKNYINTTSGIEKHESSEGISLLPNPANDKVILMSEDKTNKLKSVLMYNSFGQEIQSWQNIDGNSLQINLEKYNKGMWMIKIVTDKGNEYYRKLIIY